MIAESNGRVPIRPFAGGARRDRLDALADRVRAGLDVIETVLDRVVEPDLPPDERGSQFRLASKIAGEAAMLLRLADRALTDKASSGRIRDLAERLGPYARAGHVQRDLLRRPSHAPMRATAHGCLTGLGSVDPAFDELVRLAFASSVAAANERVPYRMLDAAWTRHLFLGDAELNHPAMDLSPIGVGVDLLAATTEDGYAFTHALVYATDFGRVPLPKGYDVAYLSSTCDALCVKALDENDLDLLGELLMAPAVLKTPWSAIQTFSWRVLERVWDQYGFVPGPGLPSAAEDESESATVRRVLGTAYHTMFVSSICVATIISTGWLPPVEMPEGPSSPVGELATTASACIDTWAATTEPERAELCELVIGMRLRRAVEHDALDLARDALAAAVAAGLADRPLSVQATEYLGRALELARPRQARQT